MKIKVKKILLFLVVLSVISCSKSNPITEIIDDDTPVENGFFVKSTINGTNLINEEDDATAFVVGTDSDGIKLAAFTGEFSDEENILLGLKGFDGIGTYNMADYVGSSMMYMFSDISNGTSQLWIANDSTGSGVINVTQYGNGTARGTFSFTGINLIDQTEIVITNGEFYLLLVE